MVQLKGYSPGLRLMSVAVTFLLVWPAIVPIMQASAQQTSDLRIVVLEGEGATLDAQQRQRRLVVQVQDASAGPIAGSDVTFTAPASGASVVFSNGTQVVTVKTDAQGVATVSGFRPNNVAGDFQFTVEASYQGRRTTTTITQRNVVAVPKKGGAGKWIAILGLAAGGGAVAALAGNKGGNGSTPTPTPTPTPTGTGTGTTTTTVQPTAGTPTVGPPG